MKTTGYQLPPLTKGKLIKRYKRFLADIVLETNETITVHCPNSGSMKGCAIANSDVWISKSDNPKRKYPCTWELIQTPESLVGINTQVPNKLVKLSIENGLVPELTGYEMVRSEVKTSAHTRLDLVLEKGAGPDCYIEIKNCTLVENSIAMFPDAVTTRGQKHLDELEQLVSKGYRGVIFFLIQRMDAFEFQPAEEIDPVYAQKLRKVVKSGVEVMAWDVSIKTDCITLRRPVPVVL